MKKLFGWERRDRYHRIALFGGHPAPPGWPYGDTEISTFQPTPVDRDAARRNVEEAVAGLLPHGVDEATSHAPANLINERANQWIAHVDREHRDFLAKATHRLGAAEAAVLELKTVYDADEAEVAELSTARAATFTAMTDPEKGNGYNDAGLVGGRPVGTYVHVVALAIAALADIGAFAQVVQLIMTKQPAIVAFAVVIGLTASVLYLAHASGVNFRERAAKVSGRMALAWVCLTMWALVGLAAFWVRLSIKDSPASTDTGGFSATATAAPATQSTDDTATLPAAIVFLALYLGSGVVALSGAYLTHNPLPGAYRTLRRRQDRAVQRLAASTAALATVAKLRKAQQDAIDEADTALRGEHAERRDLAEELKQHARMLMAHRAQDPAFTDAVFAPDRRARPPAPHTANGSTEPTPSTTDLGSPQ